MSRMSCRTGAAGALCALAAALAVPSPARAQVWTLQFLNRNVAANASCQNGPGGEFLIDSQSVNGYAEDPIPPVDLHAAAHQKGFGAAATALANLSTTFPDDRTLNLALSGTAMTSDVDGVITAAGDVNEFYLVFFVNEPTPVTLSTISRAYAPEGHGFGWASGQVWLRSFYDGPILASVWFGGPADIQQDAIVLLDPGRYSLNGYLSLGSGTQGGGFDSGAAALFDVTLQAPAPSSAALVGLGGLIASRRRR